MVKILCARISLALLALSLSSPVIAAPQGSGYTAVNPPQPTSTAGKIEVVEFFWYGCPHCYRLEPHIERWLKGKPNDVEYIRIPAILPAQWELLARGFYVAETLGVLERVHRQIFDAIHGERVRITNKATLARLFARFGVEEKKFNSTFNSFAVTSKVRRAQQLSQRYGLDGVPAIIVNGKYRITGRSAGSNRNVMKVVDQLIAKERH